MGHHHDHEAQNMGDKRLIAAVFVNVLLTFTQVIGGIISGSLSLVADATHNLSDASALGIALFAAKNRPGSLLTHLGPLVINAPKR